MSLFESIIYGLISGFTEFLPVSSQGHQALMLQLFGLQFRQPLRDFLVHLGVLLSLLVGCRSLFTHMQREQILATRARRKSLSDRKGQYELRLIKTAALPLAVCLLLYISARELETKSLVLSLLFLLNGVILLIPEYIRHGNKDARFMTGLDGLLFGFFGALSALPGISRVGIMNAYGLARGTDRRDTLNWILILSLPALGMFLCFDVVNMFSYGLGSVSLVIIFGYLLSAAAAFCGGYFSIVFIRFLSVHTGFAGFAYYSLGTALFSFVLYLIA